MILNPMNRDCEVNVRNAGVVSASEEVAKVAVEGM